MVFGEIRAYTSRYHDRDNRWTFCSIQRRAETKGNHDLMLLLRPIFADRMFNAFLPVVNFYSSI